MPSPSNNHQGLPVASLSFPIETSACDFALMSRQEGNTMFAFSLKDLDLLLDDSMQRLPTQKIANVTLTVPKDAKPENFLPIQYHDFLDVFDRKQANKLPPHRTCDHPIDLQPGKQPPASRPYSMNQHELKALQEYLNKELAKGFIRVSRSPVSAPVLFVKKSN